MYVRLRWRSVGDDEAFGTQMLPLSPLCKNSGPQPGSLAVLGRRPLPLDQLCALCLHTSSTQQMTVSIDIGNCRYMHVSL